MTREQFILFVKQEQESLRRFLLALCCGHTDDADDIAQETFVKAYVSMADYDEKGRRAIWLRRIAYTTFLNFQKAQKLRTAEFLSNSLPIPSTDNADSSFHNQELHRALTFLSETERTSIVMHYIEGYKINEIAEVTHQSESAIKKQLQRGRDELKKRISYDRR